MLPPIENQATTCRALDDLRCPHGNIINCKQCDDEFVEAMRQFGKIQAKKHEQRIIDAIMGNKLTSIS